MLANASNAIIVAFATGVEADAAENAARDGIDVKQYNIIYDLIEDVESAMRGMRSVKYRDVDTGTAEVREVYTVSSVGSIAGSIVTSGTVRRQGKSVLSETASRLPIHLLKILSASRTMSKKFHPVTSAEFHLKTGMTLNPAMSLNATLLKNTGIDYGRLSYRQDFRGYTPRADIPYA